MQIIEIDSITGTSPYDIVVCDMTNTYCYTVSTGVPSVPPILYLDLPTELIGVDGIILKIVDSNGCEEMKYVLCPPTPTPTPTNTQTPTITPTNANCVCITFDNQTSSILNYSFINCYGIKINYTISPLTKLYQCGKTPTYDDGIIVTIGNYCSNNECLPPTPTQTSTPTPTPTIPGLVGSFVSCCDPSLEFRVSNIPNNLHPLSGVYYIKSTGFNGCATYITTTTSNNLYICSQIGSQPDCVFCDMSHTDVLCPTPTQTQTPTNTPTQTQTPTNTPTQTQTPTYTPTKTQTPTYTPSKTQTQTPSQTQTQTPSQTQTQTPTPTPTETPPTQYWYCATECLPSSEPPPIYVGDCWSNVLQPKFAHPTSSLPAGTTVTGTDSKCYTITEEILPINYPSISGPIITLSSNTTLIGCWECSVFQVTFITNIPYNYTCTTFGQDYFYYRINNGPWISILITVFSPDSQYNYDVILDTILAPGVTIDYYFSTGNVRPWGTGQYSGDFTSQCGIINTITTSPYYTGIYLNIDSFVSGGDCQFSPPC